MPYIGIDFGTSNSVVANFQYGQAEVVPNHEGQKWTPSIVTLRRDGTLAFGAEAKVKTHSPMFYVHWRLGAGATAAVPAEYSERAAFIAKGSVEIEGRTFVAGQMIVFAPGETIAVTGVTDADVMLLGGESVGRRFVDWNFVSSSKGRLEQAKTDWRDGRFKLPDLDHDEFIPGPA